MGSSEQNIGQPLYLQAREIIRGRIEAGVYPPGTALPPEGTLAEEFGVHRLSICSAVTALINEGLLKGIRGKGIFVLGEKVRRDLDTLGGFTQTMRERGRVPATRILCKALRPAGSYYGALLQIEREDKLFYIRRICSSDGAPVSLEEIYIPEWVIPTLGEIDLTVFSIYEVYDFYGIDVVRADQSLDITTLDPAEAKLIDLNPNLSVLEFRCVSYNGKSQVIEYARTYTRADRCDFTVQYRKKTEQGQ